MEALATISQPEINMERLAEAARVVSVVPQSIVRAVEEIVGSFGT